MAAEPLHSAPRLTPAMAALRATWSGCTARCTSAASYRAEAQRGSRAVNGGVAERKTGGKTGQNGGFMLVEPGFVLKSGFFLAIEMCFTKKYDFSRTVNHFF